MLRFISWLSTEVLQGLQIPRRSVRDLVINICLWNCLWSDLSERCGHRSEDLHWLIHSSLGSSLQPPFTLQSSPVTSPLQPHSDTQSSQFNTGILNQIFCPCKGSQLVRKTYSTQLYLVYHISIYQRFLIKKVIYHVNSISNQNNFKR